MTSASGAPNPNLKAWVTGFVLALSLGFLPVLPVMTPSAEAAPVAAGAVSGTINLVNSKKGDPSNVAVWLEPVGGGYRRPGGRPELKQQGKRFSRRVLPITVGQEVTFPNLDPFPHNIFSNSAAKRFDLGLFQGGESRTVQFNRPGIVPVFCNIHPQMSAYLVVVQSGYHTITDRAGNFRIGGVPNGTYRLKIWHERAIDSRLASLSRTVTVNGGANIGTLSVDEAGYVFRQHKNKYGRDYN